METETGSFVSRIVFDGEEIERVIWTRLDEDGFPWLEKLPNELQNRNLNSIRKWLKSQGALATFSRWVFWSCSS